MRIQKRSHDFYKLYKYCICLVLGVLLLGSACKKAAVETTPANSTPVSAAPTPNTPDAPQGTVSVQTIQLTSQLMNRNMPYRVVLPADYRSDEAKRFPVVYLLHGLTGHFNDWTDRGGLAQAAEKHDFIFVTPEGNDGWCTDSLLVANDKYESYIVRELIPEIDRRFRTLPDRGHRIIAGLSMGGYGAIKFGLKYPQMFGLVGSFSGALPTGQWSEKSGANQLIGKSIDVVFGPVGSPTRTANDIFKLTREITADKQKMLPYMYLSCGTEDKMMLRPNNDFAALLTEKNIPHEFHTSRGGHEWEFWGGQLIMFLDLAEDRSKGDGH